MNLKYILFPIFLLACNHSFANYEQIISNFNVTPKRSQQEFNNVLTKLEDANFRAGLNRQKAYYTSLRDPLGYNNAICNALAYSTALHRLTALNPLYVSQETLNSMGNYLLTNAAIGQNARCPKMMNNELPPSKLGANFWKNNAAKDTLDFLSSYGQKTQTIKKVESDAKYLQFLCETQHHFSKLTQVYLKNYGTLSQRDYLSYQSFEKARLEADFILKRNNLESSCVNGNLTIVADSQPVQDNQIVYNYSGINKIQKQEPEIQPQKTTMSNEQKACAITNMIFRSIDKKSDNIKCN